MSDPLVKWPTLFAHLNPALIRAGDRATSCIYEEIAVWFRHRP